MSTQIRIAIVDDHPLFLEGIAATLKSAQGFKVVGRGRCGDDAIQICRECAPEVILLDVNMPGGGVTTAATIAANFPSTKVVMLSMSESDEHVTKAMAAGAKGYLTKEVSLPELVSAIKSIVSGRQYVSPELAASMFSKLDQARRSERKPVVPKLTRREEEILELVATGKTNREVSVELNIAERTVKHYMTEIMSKLQVRNRVEVTLVARGVLSAM